MARAHKVNVLRLVPKCFGFRVNRRHRSERIAREFRQIKFAIVGTHHKEAALVQKRGAVGHQRHQVFTHIEVLALEAGKTRRVQNDGIKLEALLLRPVNVFNGIASKKFALLGFEPVKRIVFAALVQEKPLT